MGGLRKVCQHLISWSDRILASHSSTKAVITNTGAKSETRVAIKQRGCPSLFVTQAFSQFRIIRAVEVLPRRELAPVRRSGVNEFPPLEPAASMLQHVDTLGPTPAKSPGKQGFKQRRAIVQGLIIDKLDLFNAGPWIQCFVENGISDQAGTVNNGDDPEPVAQ